jgi:hypothetical protein
VITLFPVIEKMIWRISLTNPSTPITTGHIFPVLKSRTEEINAPQKSRLMTDPEII